MKYIPADVIHNFFEELTNSKILYVLIKNVSNELPDHLIDGKDKIQEVPDTIKFL